MREILISRNVDGLTELYVATSPTRTILHTSHQWIAEVVKNPGVDLRLETSPKYSLHCVAHTGEIFVSHNMGVEGERESILLCTKVGHDESSLLASKRLDRVIYWGMSSSANDSWCFKVFIKIKSSRQSY